MDRPADLCPRPLPLPPLATAPHAPPIYPTSVWECESPQQADDVLAGRLPGFVYQRDGHPNAYLLAEKCRRLHAADQAAVTASGMGALAVAMLSQLKAGDHALLGSRLYGKSHQLFGVEAGRLGIEMTTVDTCDLAATTAAIRPNTRLLLAETIANPLLEVANIAAMAEIAHRRGVVVLIDNTFASPILCRPLDLGADLVMESLTKTMNGHSDVILGLLAGKDAVWSRVPQVITAFGIVSSPFDCWLAERGLATAHLRIERACHNALTASEFLSSQSPRVERVFYPGLADHPQHALAKRQFGGLFGTMVSFQLAGGRPAADKFIPAARQIPFCPSLGELNTTLSHPETTSHRGMTSDQRAALGITGGTIRLSVGTESPEFICEAVAEGLKAL